MTNLSSKHSPGGEKKNENENIVKLTVIMYQMTKNNNIKTQKKNEYYLKNSQGEWMKYLFSIMKNSPDIASI